MKKSELFAKLKDHLQLKNINQVPKIDKVIVSMGIGSLVTRKGHKDFEEFEKNLIRITGQKPVLIRSKKAISNFKLREGMDKTINGYAFHVPRKVAELIYEGKKLHHCVSSYTDKHFKGDTLIVFVRLSNQPKKPLYTLEVRQGKIAQFRGKYNQDVPAEVWDIAKEWMKQTKLVQKSA